MGDEYYALLVCPVFQELRIQFIPEYYYNRPNMYKLISLFQTKDDVILKRMSIFIVKILNTINNYILDTSVNSLFFVSMKYLRAVTNSIALTDTLLG